MCIVNIKRDRAQPWGEVNEGAHRPHPQHFPRLLLRPGLGSTRGLALIWQKWPGMSLTECTLELTAHNFSRSDGGLVLCI